MPSAGSKNLTDDEKRRIADWLAELKVAWKNGSIKVVYSACPAWEHRRDPVNGRSRVRRFSCAGFVWCCFMEAIDVQIVAPEAELPEVDVETLKRVWGDIVEHRAAPRYLRGSPPWRLLLPSYFFHALVGDRAALPHRPTRAEPCFAG